MKKIILLFTFLFISISLVSQTSISLNKVNGVYIIPCKVNGIPMKFIFDTGATNVTISQTEAKFLIKQGLLKKEDIKETVKYQIANGDINEGTQIILREIEVSGLIINNITATVVHEQNAPLLLGMSALSQLGKIEIENNKLVINDFKGTNSNKDFDIEKEVKSTIEWINSKFVKYQYETYDSDNYEIKHKANIKKIVKAKGQVFLFGTVSQKTRYKAHSFVATFLIPINEINNIDFIEKKSSYWLKIKMKNNVQSIITKFDYDDNMTLNDKTNEITFLLDKSIDKENLKPKLKRAFEYIIDLYKKKSSTNKQKIESNKTDEIKIEYQDGLEIFNIYSGTNQPELLENKKYFWYTEFSKIKSTKGGNGGKLLNGEYKLYDKQRNLIKLKNFNLGLLDGIQKKWDEKGNIIEIEKYKNGEIYYWKKFEEDGSAVEHLGTMLTKGWIKKSYDTLGNLYAEQTQLGDAFGENLTKLYYKDGTLKEQFTKNGVVGVFVGEYKSYYKNGNIELEGHFYEKKYHSSIRNGVWKWYKENGEFDGEETYKVEVEKWKNGKIKIIGSYVYDTENKEWLKSGYWEEYTEKGMFMKDKEKKYVFGKEVEIKK